MPHIIVWAVPGRHWREARGPATCRDTQNGRRRWSRHQIQNFFPLLRSTSWPAFDLQVGLQSSSPKKHEKRKITTSCRLRAVASCRKRPSPVRRQSWRCNPIVLDFEGVRATSLCLAFRNKLFKYLSMSFNVFEVFACFEGEGHKQSETEARSKDLGESGLTASIRSQCSPVLGLHINHAIGFAA